MVDDWWQSAPGKFAPPPTLRWQSGGGGGGGGGSAAIFPVYTILHSYYFSEQFLFIHFKCYNIYLYILNVIIYIMLNCTLHS